MIKKIGTMLMMFALSGLTAIPALAAGAETKSFKMFVTLPESVGRPATDLPNEISAPTQTLPRQTTEEVVILRDHQKILMRTIVVQ